MKKILFALSLGVVLGGVACTEDSTKDPNYQPPEILFEEEVPDYEEGLPTPGAITAYEEAKKIGIDRPYYPVTVKY